MPHGTDRNSYAAARDAALAGCRCLFMRPGEGGALEVADCAGDGFAELVIRLVELSAPDRLSRPVYGETRETAPCDVANEIARRFGAGNFLPRLLEALFWSFSRDGGALPELRERNAEESLFLSEQAAAILNFPSALASALPDSAGGWSPDAVRMLRSVGRCTVAETAGKVAAGDPFAGGRAFRYMDGRFLPAGLENIRPAGRFFGFFGPRRIFHEHFRDFAGGKSCVPLLISSLPGHGKTQLTVAHSLAHPGLTLILASSETLERPLETLLDTLRRRPDRRFVVFFDDVNPGSLDWYTFRTNVGGAFSPPGNVLLAIASNYEFPAEILSRGRSVAFPTFDDVRCLEMVEDFFRSNGFRRPNANLISLVAAEYTEEFGQKRYTELSPRTLMRHLELYERDQRRRRDAVQLSCGPVVTKPDSQLFYEFNIRLMRKLYGNEYIENMLKDKLRAMG